MISASQVLNATETCFLEPQDTAARPSWKTKPLKLIRSPILNPRIRIFLPLGWRLWRGGSSSLVVLLLSLSTRYARISSYLSYGGLVRTTTCLGACSCESVSHSLWLSLFSSTDFSQSVTQPVSKASTLHVTQWESSPNTATKPALPTSNLIHDFIWESSLPNSSGQVGCGK